MPGELPKIEQEKTLISWIGKSRPTGGNSGEMQMKPVLMVLGILIAIILMFAGEWMLLWVLAAGVFYFYATRRSETMEVEFTLSNRGVMAFGRKYGWEEMSRWWWDEKLTNKVLVIELVSGFLGRLYMPVSGAKPAEIEKVMNKYVIMDKPKESWLDMIGRWVKEKFPLENKI